MNFSSIWLNINNLLKHALNISVLLLLSILPARECFAQGKKFDFIKTLKYSPINYEVKSDTNFYLSSINWDRSSNNRYYSKTIEFNPQGEMVSYQLSSNIDLGHIYLFWNSYYGNFGIDYTMSDTVKGTFSKISFEFESDTLKKYILEVELYGKETSHFFNLESTVIEYYKNWLLDDAKVKNENTFIYPDFFDLSKLPKEKIRRHYLSTVTVEDTIIRTQYYIDSNFQNGISIRDSLLIRQTKSLKIQKGNESINYLAHILPESIEIEAYTYDSVLMTTNQRMSKTFRGDTLYDIFLNTRMDGSNFISDYFIKGNHPKVTPSKRRVISSTYRWCDFDTLRQREIHIVRDSSGKIISGTGSGLSSGGEHVESRLVIYPLFKQEGFTLMESNTPMTLKFEGPEKSENRIFEIISTYPNLDLKPLSTIQLINEDGIIGGNFYPYQLQTSKKVKRRFRVSTSPTYKQFILRKSKRIKSSDRNVKIRNEDGYNEYTIYEFHYKKK